MPNGDGFQAYEYKALLVTVGMGSLQDVLTQRGKEGWRLTQSMPANVQGNAILIFERPAPEQPAP